MVDKYAPESDYEIALVVVEDGWTRASEFNTPNSLIARIVQKCRTRVFESALWLEKHLGHKVGIFDRLPSRKLADLDVPVKVFRAARIGPGLARYEQEGLAILTSLEIDVLVHLNSAVAFVGGNPLAAIEEVVFRGSDSSAIESIEALCFTAVQGQKPTVEAEVYKYQAARDKAHHVGKISVPTKWMTTVTLEAFQVKAAHLVHLALTQAGKTNGETFHLRQVTEVAVPTAWASVWQLHKTLGSMIYRLISRATQSDPRWHVAYSLKNKWEDFSDQGLMIIRNPRGRFYADPFLISHQGKNYCFVEDYGEDNGKGLITVLELNAAGHRYLGTALEEDFHLSFPFTFKFGQEIYMCPEAAGSGQIRLYRAVDFPLSWTLDQVLMDKVSAADTTLFRQGTTWWMLTNLSPEGGPNHQSELHVFSSEKLHTADWRPHPMNPVINDATKARNAGLIVSGKSVFRAFQIFGFDTYGAGIGINRISQLSRKVYEEEEVREVLPSSRNLKGLHTISASGDVLVTDLRLSSSQRKYTTVWSRALEAPE